MIELLPEGINDFRVQNYNQSRRPHGREPGKTRNYRDAGIYTEGVPSNSTSGPGSKWIALNLNESRDLSLAGIDITIAKAKDGSTQALRETHAFVRKEPAVENLLKSKGHQFQTDSVVIF